MSKISSPDSPAFEIWTALLGPENVLRDPARCAGWGRRTFGQDMPVSAILRPGNRQDVVSVLRTATDNSVAVHPVSRGANWGMGSRAPLEAGAVILDLSRMSRISGYDPEQGVIRVEPGVTFQALADYLTGQQSRFFVPEIGGSPEASVLANALDRGDGAMGDRWSSLSDLEVVLPDGRIIDTGFSATGAHRLSGLHPGATGPMIDGLFSQSNLGVVVGASIRLEPMPDNLAVFNARIDGLDKLPGMVSALRRMQIAGAVRDRSVTLWNGVKFLARENARIAYDEAEVRRAETETWLMSGYLQAETDAILTARAEGVVHGLMTAGAEASGTIARSDGVWQPGCEGLLGTPSPRNLRTVYWSSQEIPDFDDMDPDQDGCGLLWLCLAFPFDGAVVAAFVKQAAQLLRPHRIDLNIGLEAASFRCLLSYISMSYRRDEPDADEMALHCYRELLAAAEASGLAPYRLANGLPKTTASAPSASDTYLSEIRAVGDPKGILSKGRAGIG